MIDPQPNYDYSGIGKAEALLVFSAIATSQVAWLTAGFLGKVSFQLLWWACTWLANKEVLVMNLAATDIQILFQKGEFDASFDNAFKQIHASPNGLTPEQKAAIDAPVKAAFAKFAVFSQLPNDTKS